MRRKLIRKYKKAKVDFELSRKKFIRYFHLSMKARFCGVRDIPYKEIPIVINNFNRLETLLKLLYSLEVRGYKNICIIDNGSSYPPQLDYYRECPYTVYLLHKNVGHLAVWETGIYKQFTDSYFAYTDSDLEIHPDCPDDFMEKFVSLLKKYPKALKAGFSICIDDLPDCYLLKDKVRAWESQFWKQEVEPNVFLAPIDTTFAVYKPYFKGELIDFDYVYFRTGFPYSVRHLPWYVDSGNLSEEERYYIGHLKTSTHWSEQSK